MKPHGNPFSNRFHVQLIQLIQLIDVDAVDTAHTVDRCLKKDKSMRISKLLEGT